MDLETIKWIAGVGVPAIVGWAFAVTWTGRNILGQTRVLVKMHEDPERYHFGTKETNRLLSELAKSSTKAMEENTQATKELNQSVRYMYKLQHPKNMDAPPYEARPG